MRKTRRFSRSSTLMANAKAFTRKSLLNINIDNNNNIEEKNNEDSEEENNNMSSGQIPYINVDKENNVPKKNASDESSMVSIDYKSEYRLLKKKKDHKMDLEIKNLAKILSSKDKGEEIKNENSLIYLLTSNSKRYTKENKDKLTEIIKYILLKQKKNEEETLIIKTFFMRNEKLTSLILPSNIISSENLINKLSTQFKFEEYNKNNIICKEGDKGEKLYIMLKGKSGVIVQKEGKGGEITQFEFIKYLIVLYLYQEMSMITRIIYYNKQVMKIEERCILTLFILFRFYKYYKDHNFFLSESKKVYEEGNLYEFIINEKKLKDFIYLKYDYPVEDSVHIFDYSQKLINQLFEFYERKVEEISKKLEENQDSNEDQIHKKCSIFFKPGNFFELNIYSNYYKNKIKRYKKLKNAEEIFNKVFSINEIPKEIIYTDNIQDYIERVDFQNILKNIEEDAISSNDDTFRLREKKQMIRYFYYNEVNVIKEGNIFGELALNSMNKKRTATIITKEESYFAVLSKKVYDSYLKVAQIKSRIKKMMYFTEGPIFKGLLPGTFLNKYFFRIKKMDCSKGKILFNRYDLRNKIYFIVKGEFELSAKMTLNEMNEIINELGGVSDNKKEKYLINLYDEFKNYYFSEKINMKVCVVNKNQVIGLDDMSINNNYIFNCKCISADETEIYEFNYKNFEDALKENELIMKNNINYVNKRREFFIKILFEQKNSLMDLQYKKIIEELKLKKLNEIDINKKNNMLNKMMKNIKYNKKINKKAIRILENFKNKEKIKTSKLLNAINNNDNNDNNNLNENSKNNINNVKIYLSSENNIKKKFKSEKNIYKYNLQDNNKLFDKSQTIFYPKVTSERNLHINNLKTLNFSDKNKSNEKKLENINNKNNKQKMNNKKIKLKIQGINSKKGNPNNINENIESSNYLNSSFNSILKTLNPKSSTNIIESRQKRYIIPILNKPKLSLNRNKNKTINKNVGYKIPSMFKEYSKKYMIEKTKVSNPDDFYLDYQKEIFNIFNEKNNNIILSTLSVKNSKLNNDESKETKENISNKLENKSVFVNFNNKNLDKKYKIKKEAGIIDCLFLDNWAEKTQFEKKFFS